MAKARTIVIVGGALAGPTAAARAREADEHARIVLLERAGAVSYAVGGLTAHLAGEARVADLDTQGPEYFRDVYDVEVRTGVEVTRLDARTRTLATSAGSVGYDALVYAAGVESLTLALPGIEGARNVFHFRNLSDLRALDAGLRRARRVAVLGGGFWGVEAADALLRRKLEVVLVERGPQLLAGFAPGAAEAARVALTAAGAEVVLGREATGVGLARGAVRRLHLGDRVLEVDAVVIAIGVRPRTALLEDAGARLLPGGAVLVDGACRTSLPAVFACGTCVAVEHAVSRRRVWLPQAAIADRTAQVAGAAAAGASVAMGPVVGTAIVRAGEVTVARTGLRQDEAPEATVARVHPPSHDVFVPGAARLSLELLVDPGGRLLGAEAWGRAGVDKRIDVLATAVFAGLDADDVASLDLAYAPPFGTVRDAVNAAGAVAAADLGEPGLGWSPAELARRGARAVLVDVRDPAARKAGVIAGSHAATLTDLRAGRLKLPPGTVVFLSSDGRRGNLAARAARARGLADAGYLSGGIASWVAEGRPLEAPPRAPRPPAAPKAASSRARRAARPRGGRA